MLAVSQHVGLPIQTDWTTLLQLRRIGTLRPLLPFFATEDLLRSREEGSLGLRGVGCDNNCSEGSIAVAETLLALEAEDEQEEEDDEGEEGHHSQLPDLRNAEVGLNCTALWLNRLNWWTGLLLGQGTAV